MPEAPRMAEIHPNVALDTPRHIDDNVILGYMTGRSIPDHELRIGAQANLRSGTIIYGGTHIGVGLETGHNVVIREENVIGDHVGIWGNTVIDYGCTIGNNVKIHTNCYIAQFTVIEDDVFIAPGVSIANDPHPLCAECTADGGPTIKRGARIGVNVTILPGVTIGEHALIGAGSVVTRDIPPGVVAYGNPARPGKPVDELQCPHDPEGKAYVNGQDRRTRHP